MIVRCVVGYTVRRPVVPDERYAVYLIDEPWDDAAEALGTAERRATLRALQWCASRPGVVMPTSVTVVDLLEV